MHLKVGIWQKTLCSVIRFVKMKYFTDHSKAVLLLWIICVVCALCLSCFRVSYLLPCGHLKRNGWSLFALVCEVYCDFVTFQFGILGQVWYLTVSIPYPCCLSYFVTSHQEYHTGQCLTKLSLDFKLLVIEKSLKRITYEYAYLCILTRPCFVPTHTKRTLVIIWVNI